VLIIIIIVIIIINIVVFILTHIVTHDYDNNLFYFAFILLSDNNYCRVTKLQFYSYSN